MEPDSGNRTTAVERLANDLRREILARQLPPDTPLREEELVRRHGVSRHVVRAALRQLVADGIAVYNPFRGARVASITQDDVIDVYRARRLIESGALPMLEPGDVADLARAHGRFATAVADGDWETAFELDRAFHQRIAAAAGSSSIVRMHAELYKRLELAHLVHPEFREPGLRQSVAEHAEIIVALSARSTDAAREALVGHLLNAEEQLAASFPAARMDGSRRLRSA